jgi:hypothetical protein
VLVDGRPLRPQGGPPVLGEHNGDLDALRQASEARRRLRSGDAA